MSHLRRLVSGATRTARGAVSLVVFVGVVAGVTVLLAGRGSGTTPSTAGADTAGADTAIASVAATVTPSATATTGLTASPAGPTPSIAEPSAEASTAAEPSPTPAPTARPTPAPTKRPATPKPVVDPAPEPTPRIGRVSGSFGQTLTVDGISVRLSPRPPSDDPLVRCGLTDDPEMQGFTEIVSFDLRVTWSKPSEANEPWIGIGTTPFNVLWFDSQGPFTSGVEYVFSTCHRPADSDKARVVISPDGEPVRQDEFTFR